MVRFPKYFPERIFGIVTGQSNQSHGHSRSHSRMASLVLTLSLVVTSCATAPDTVVVGPDSKATPEAVETPNPTDSTESGKPPISAQPDGQADLDKQPSEMVTVSVYSIDDQCNGFVEESVQVPSDQAISEAVGKAMNSVDYNAFKLAGYQVNVDGRTAIVDMQLAPGSERQFVSLSSCEQRALFGSVEETLLNNDNWGVEAVKFTQGGKDIVL
ncbi:MAG: hypothetical protein WBB01_25910 [Phormidesmis sp.]